MERRTPAGVRVQARLLLLRDSRLVQHLRPVVAPSADSAAAMIATGVDARDVLDEATTLLVEEPNSYWGLAAAARALDAMGDRPRAADAWLRLVATDTNDVCLGQRVVENLLRGGNAAPARPRIDRLAGVDPDDLVLQRLPLAGAVHRARLRRCGGDRHAARARRRAVVFAPRGDARAATERVRCARRGP